MCKLLAMSTILDPRFKKIHFRSAMTAVTAIADLNKMMKSANCDPEISVAPTSKPSESFTVQSIWEFHDNLIANDMQSNDPSELHLELRQYLNQPVIPRQASPIQYWYSVKNAFPTVYVLTLKYHRHLSTIEAFVFEGWGTENRTTQQIVG